jgi:hypothetical protein
MEPVPKPRSRTATRDFLAVDVLAGQALAWLGSTG